jgi:energy-coupling factor transporter ATP-binding protein EcfA2
LIKNRQFLYRIGKKIGELGLIGEVRNRLIIFLAAMTTIIPDHKRRTSVIVTGPSGSGKTTLIELPLMVMPPEFIVRRASFSRQALAYGEESLDKKILFVEEYQGGKDAQYLLRLLQSQGEVSHERTTGNTTEVKRRLGSPVVLTATTGETILQDDATRFLEAAVDDSKEQSLEVLKAELSRKGEGEVQEIEVWQEAVRLLLASYQQPFSFPPWFRYVAEQVPVENVRARRDWKRFLGLMESVALCSPDPGRDGEITFADYCVGYRIFNSALTASTHAVNENELRLLTVIREMYKEFGRPVTIKEAGNRLGWNSSVSHKYKQAALRHKLIEYEPGTREKNIKRLLPVAGASAAFLPNPVKVFADLTELGPSVEFVDPISGKLKTGNRVRRAAA